MFLFVICHGSGLEKNVKVFYARFQIKKLFDNVFHKNNLKLRLLIRVLLVITLKYSTAEIFESVRKL